MARPPASPEQRQEQRDRIRRAAAEVYNEDGPKGGIDQPDVFRGAVLFVRPVGSPTPEVEPPEALPFFRLLREALVDGQADGSVRPGDPDTLAQLLWAAVHGALSLPIHIDRYAVKTQAELAAAMVDHLVAALVATPSALA